MLIAHNQSIFFCKIQKACLNPKPHVVSNVCFGIEQTETLKYEMNHTLYYGIYNVRYIVCDLYLDLHIYEYYLTYLYVFIYITCMYVHTIINTNTNTQYIGKIFMRKLVKYGYPILFTEPYVYTFVGWFCL